MPELDGETEPQSVPARVLLVEDEPLIRFNMADVLRDLGVSVVTPVAQCDGPDLTCAPATVPTLTAKVSVTLAF